MQPPDFIDHLGMAVQSLEEASRLYRDVLGFTCGGTEEIPDQKVRVAFFQVGQVRIELLEPTSSDSPIARFLERKGPGLHHVAYCVADLPATLASLKSAGIRLIDETPRPGAHGMQIAFAHPKSTGGVLIEFCQPVASSQAESEGSADRP
jgi:methylmalonyl-CoA/ethylmalonyl-CoA epimerase